MSNEHVMQRVSVLEGLNGRRERAIASSAQSIERRMSALENADVPVPEIVLKPVEWGAPSIRLHPESMAAKLDRMESADMARDGYFTSVITGGNRPSRALRWTPGTDRIFPTFDQMAAAKSTFMDAEAWDFTGLAKDGAHIFGIPVRMT
jgi:hypothetical protein